MIDKKRSAQLAAAFAIFLGLGFAAVAQTPQSSRRDERLSLAVFLQEVIRTNPDVMEGYLQWLIKAREARGSWGDFEPTVVGGYKLTSLRQQNTALLQFEQLGNPVYDERNNVYSIGLQGSLPSGASYNVSTSISRLQDTYVEQGQYQSIVSVSAQQPLLKGFTHGAPMASIHTAFVDRIIAFQQYRKQLMNTIVRAEIVYWNLAFAQQAQTTAEESVRIATYVLDVAQQGRALGKRSDLDVQQAQAELASRQAALEQSELSASEAEAQLRLLVGGSAVDRTIVAIDSVASESEEAWDPDFERVKLLAWADRAQPGYMIELQQLERERILVGYQQDQALPELNLTGSYGYSGLGVTLQESMSTLDSRSYPAWSVGLEMKIPLLLGVRPRNELKAEELKRDLAEIRVKAAKDQMIRTISMLVEQVGTLRRYLANARTVTSVKQRLLEVAVAQLKEGAAGLGDVYGAQESLLQARQQELQDIVQYRRAVMELEMAAGTVLKDQGLEAVEGDQVVLSENVRSR